MHKKLIKRKPPTYQMGGGLTNIFKGFTGQQIRGKLGPDGKPLPVTEAETMNGQIGGSIMSGVKAFGSFMDINGSNMNSNQKTMAKADGAVEGVASIASNFGPAGQAIGMGLNIANQLGGKLINTPKVIKDYSINDTVGQSSSFGGVNDMASQTGQSADSFASAGLAGKLFGKKNLLKDVNSSNILMNQTSKILNTSKQALDTANQSSDMFSARNNFKLNSGNMFTNGSVQFGQTGMALKKVGGLFDINKTAFVDSVLDAPANRNKEFVKRLREQNAPSLQTNRLPGNDLSGKPYSSYPKTEYSSHLMGWDGNLTVSPQIVRENNKLKYLSNEDKRDDYAQQHNELIKFNTPDLAKWFADNGYKNGTGVNNSINSKGVPYNNPNLKYELGGSIERYNSLLKTSKSINLKKIKKAIVRPSSLIIQAVDDDLIMIDPSVTVVIEQGNKELDFLKEGGVIAAPKSVIADGALHARKHTLKQGEFAEADITLKGIPVITKDAEGGIIQHAEIEKDELILHYNLTKELEELYKIGDDNSMIEAGKILSKELVKNTKDSKSKIIKNS